MRDYMVLSCAFCTILKEPLCHVFPFANKTISNFKGFVIKAKETIILKELRHDILSHF